MVWWIPLSINVLAVALFVLGMFLQRDWLINCSIFLFYMNFAITIASIIYQITNKKWKYVLLQLICMIALLFLLVMIFLFSPPDYYATHKKIPEDIEFSWPIDSLPTQQDYAEYDLFLIQGGQPGIYEYYTDYSPVEIGHFYIKAFEIVSNDRLSKEAILKSSIISVDSLQKKVRKGKFKIYEGGFSDQYGCRIELWYQPKHSRSYKLTERNYVVSGWQR